MSDFAAARQNMVQSQLEPNGVSADDVAYAMAQIPREQFVPHSLAGVAYLDKNIEIAPGRFLMETMVFARLLQAADIGPGDVVLDLGSGSGYSAAVLSKLAATVVALESDETLATQATDTLAELGIDNAAVVAGDCRQGMPDQGPYDAIIFEGSIAAVPEGFADQLADGGRLVAVIGTGPMGMAMRLVRQHGSVSRQNLFDAATPPLFGLAEAAGFEF